MENHTRSLNKLNAELALLEEIAPKIAAITAEQSTLLALIEMMRKNLEVNIKFLETFYSGSRSSFQLFVKKLVETHVIDLSTNPHDRRSKIVSFTPETKNIIKRYFENMELVSEDSYLQRDVKYEIFCSSRGKNIHDNLRKNLPCSADHNNCLNAAATIWQSIPIEDQLPILTADRVIDFSSVFDLRRAHIVEAVGQAVDDFKYSRIGDVGQREATIMRNNLLSTLPDCKYKQEIYDDYRLSLTDITPIFRKVNTSNPIIQAEYDRLVLPFKGDERRSMRLHALIGQVAASN